jgi:DNA-binding ferritin-like protein (Dps family)
MNAKKIPKKYKQAIKEITEELVFGNEFAAAVESALTDCESWEDFQNTLYNDMQSYIDDARQIKNALCR